MHFCNLKALSGVTKTATILTISTRLRSHATVAMEIGRELAIGNWAIVLHRSCAVTKQWSTMHFTNFLRLDAVATDLVDVFTLDMVTEGRSNQREEQAGGSEGAEIRLLVISTSLEIITNPAKTATGSTRLGYMANCVQWDERGGQKLWRRVDCTIPFMCIFFILLHLLRGPQLARFFDYSKLMKNPGMWLIPMFGTADNIHGMLISPATWRWQLSRL